MYHIRKPKDDKNTLGHDKMEYGIYFIKIYVYYIDI